MKMDEIKQQIKEVMKEERDAKRTRTKQAARVFMGNGVGILYLLMGIVVLVALLAITADLPRLEQTIGLSIGALFAMGTLNLYVIESNHAADYFRLVKIAEKLGIPEEEME